MIDELQPEGFWLRVNGARLFVRIAGTGQPVLLLHGGGVGTSGEGWRQLMAELSGICQLIAPDFLGYGYSDAPDTNYSNERFVADIHELMNLLSLDDVVLAGHSMGAIIAATIAVQRSHAVRRLVLLSPGGGTYGIQYQSEGIPLLAKVATDPTEANLRRMVELMSARPELYDAEVKHRLAFSEKPGIVRTENHLAVARQKSRADNNQNRALLGDKVRTLNIPISLIWGELERFNPNDLGPKIRDALPPHASYDVVEGAGHDVQVDQPERLAQVFRSLISA